MDKSKKHYERLQERKRKDREQEQRVFNRQVDIAMTTLKDFSKWLYDKNKGE